VTKWGRKGDKESWRYAVVTILLKQWWNEAGKGDKESWRYTVVTILLKQWQNEAG